MKIESWVGKFQRFHSLNDEQMEAAVHLFRSKDVVAILPSDFEESLIYQPYATAKKVNGANVETNTTRRDDSFHRFVNKA